MLSVTSRRLSTPFSCEAMMPTPCSHCARRTLYSELASECLTIESISTMLQFSGANGNSVYSSERQSSLTALPLRPMSEANWSMIPQRTPMYSCSVICPMRASCSRVKPQPNMSFSANPTELSNAADDERPAPRGTSPPNTISTAPISAPRFFICCATPYTYRPHMHSGACSPLKSSSICAS